ncbi:MAG: FtsX-like permease family protein, partial [Ferruginibacter sp.]
AVIVNEAFVKESGLHDPIGKSILINMHYDSAVKVIKGVVKDFHFSSLREPIKPAVLYLGKSPEGGIWVKFEKLKQQEAMAALARTYKKIMPGAVYQYNFLDELNARQYQQEQRWQNVISAATVISLVICCLGLLGLAHLSAGRRIKEVGIRKVLGASVMQVVVLLSRDFLKLVVIAFVIAAPVSWMAMHNWLQDFAYRINIGPGIFLIAGLLSIVIALIAVSSQAIKAALANPVKNLRTE